MRVSKKANIGVRNRIEEFDHRIYRDLRHKRNRKHILIFKSETQNEMD